MDQDTRIGTGEPTTGDRRVPVWFVGMVFAGGAACGAVGVVVELNARASWVAAVALAVALALGTLAMAVTCHQDD